MYYTVYKITNLINGKIYIGVHKTKDINDDYMGSGKHLKRAQEKYGIENFEKEVLKVFDNAEDMFSMESELVNEDFIQNPETYNLKVGGFGGWDHINQEGNPYWSKEFAKIRSDLGLKSRKIALEWLYENDKDWVDKMVLKRNKTMYEKYGEKAFVTFEGKKHSSESKKRIGEANSKHQSGTGNSQFGTMWIHNLEEKLSKKIKKDELQNYENLGWIKGRKMKF